MAVTSQPLSFLPPRKPRDGTARPERRTRFKPATRESLAVFAICAIVYLALGYRVVIDQHLIIFDAVARLAHAYFVVFNAPPKLSAVGFVWAPFSTLAFLPFAAIKPLATSLIALPLTSGLFAAWMAAVLVRAARYLGLPAWQRLPLVALFAFNPLILFYAINGMSEAPYLAFLVLAIYFFIRWYLEGEAQYAVLSAVAITFTVLTRYETIGYAIVLTLAIPYVLMSRRRPQSEVEGTTIGFLAPIVYGVGLWIFFNWLILGDPLLWLRAQIGLGSASDTPVSAAFGQQHQETQATAPELLRSLVDLNAELFPLVLVAGAALVVAGVFVKRARQPMTIVMFALLSVNVLTTVALVLKNADSNLLQLRYNMRAMPVAILAVGWLWFVMPGKRSRLVVWAASMAVLVVTIPLTWELMRSWPQQYEEKVFVRAIETGEDQEGSDPGGPYTIGNADDREMAQWLDKHVPKVRDSILTDDAQTLGVMLASGRPDLFLDRIDKGDQRWKRTLEDPWGHVRYVLVARYPRPPDGIIDEIQKRYPGLGPAEVPGFSVEHANAHYVLLRVAPRRPSINATRFDKAVTDTWNDRIPRL